MLKKILTVCMLVVIAGCASSPRPSAPTVDEIIQLSKQQVPPETIIQRMRDSRAVYYMSASQLAKLKEQGVADSVIDFMQNTQIEDVRRYGGPGPNWGIGGIWGTGGSGVGIGVGF